MTLDSPVDPEVDHIRGPEDAQLTLVEFVDFECPYCAHATGSWEDPHGRFGDGAVGATPLPTSGPRPAIEPGSSESAHHGSE